MPTNVVGLHQMHPPGCQCGCGGNWGCDSPEWGSDLMQCWNQINQLKCLIKQIMDEVGGPVRTGPIKGVIDGSDAKPGEVGEFVQLTASLAYAAYPQITTSTISIGVISPGDWDFTVSMWCTTNVDALRFNLSPQPTGMSNPMTGLAFQAAGGVAEQEQLVLIGQSARGSFSVPTLLPFAVSVSQGQTATAPAGTAYMTLEARRRR